MYCGAHPDLKKRPVTVQMCTYHYGLAMADFSVYWFETKEVWEA